jgi:hypothetical protein
MKLNQLLALGCIFSVLTFPAHATYPTIDVGNIRQNTISAIENRIQSYEAVQQTVSLLEQVAQLYAIYENGMNMYSSLGNAVDSISSFNSDRLTNSWSSSLDFSFAGIENQLSRWRVKPSEHGMLANINESLFGAGSVGGNFGDAANDVRRLSKKTGSFSRDRAIRGIVRDVGDGADRAEIKGVGVMDVSDADNGNINRVVTTSQGEVVVTATQGEKAKLLTAVADTSMARANTDIAQQMLLNQQDDVVLEEFIQDAKTDGNADQTKLMAQGNLLEAMQTKKISEMMNQQASIASADMASDRANLELLQTIEANERSAANASAALSQ